MTPTHPAAEFFRLTCAAAVRHAVTLLRLSGWKVQAHRLWELVREAPRSAQEAGHPDLRQLSLCGECLAYVARRAKYLSPADQAAFAVTDHFFRHELPGLSADGRAWLEAAWEGVFGPAEEAEIAYEKLHGYGSLDRTREFILPVPTPDT
ncbi:MAG: hypothetical protein ABGY75_20205 [Gemmataceae bacterium]